MKAFSRLATLATSAVALLASAGGAFAGMGRPSPWEIGLQGIATPIMREISTFYDFVLWIIFGIAAFVLALIIIVIVRFNARANPTPSRTTHNTPLEVVWTIVPVIILAAIAVPSFRLLFAQLDVPPHVGLTVKVTGHQWYWSYSYPGNGNFEFNSMVLRGKDRKPGEPRLLAVNDPMVVPVNTVVKVLITGADVIHSFNVPSFGIRIDAIPGRMNYTWFKATRKGVFYGECSELCGTYHAFMPIEVKVVSASKFAAWVKHAQKEYAAGNGAPPNLYAAANTTLH
jgi:cytochrome c oxidase subunit 2